MAELRVPADEDREAIASLMRISFPISPAMIPRLSEFIDPSQFLCAYGDDGALVATARVFPLDQWYGGRPVSMAGVASVATQPEARGTGIASELLTSLLREERRRGTLMTTLYPATVPVYRRLGYEYAGQYTSYEIDLRALPPGGAGAVSELSLKDLDGVRDRYRTFAETQNGLVESLDDDWWRNRVMRLWNGDASPRVVGVEEEGRIAGYAAFIRENLADGGFKLDCNHLVASSRSALEKLLGYFRRFHGVGRKLAFRGSPIDPVALVVPERTLRVDWTFPTMSRLLDVRGALLARGYPEVTGAATIRIADDVIPENDGGIRFALKEGTPVVEPADGGDGTDVSIGAFSAMFAGYLSPGDALRLGFLRDFDTARFLSRAFAGAPPWTSDFF